MKTLLLEALDDSLLLSTKLFFIHWKTYLCEKVFNLSNTLFNPPLLVGYLEEILAYNRRNFVALRQIEFE